MPDQFRADSIVYPIPPLSEQERNALEYYDAIATRRRLANRKDPFVGLEVHYFAAPRRFRKVGVDRCRRLHHREIRSHLLYSRPEVFGSRLGILRISRRIYLLQPVMAARRLRLERNRAALGEKHARIFAVRAEKAKKNQHFLVSWSSCCIDVGA